MFETERLFLRGVDAETDLNTFLHWDNNQDFVRTVSPQPLMPTSREQCKEFIKPRPAGSLPLLVVCEKPARPEPDHVSNTSIDQDYFKSSPRPIGVMNFQNSHFDFKNRTAMIGLGFPDKQHRGKGYGQELLEWALHYSFMELGLHRVQLGAYSFNEPALKLYRKIGFIEEGRQRETYFMGGKWYDTILMAVLEEEYLDAKQRG